MRINRYLASAGLGSRRACEELVQQERVTINGHAVTSLATLVAPGDVVKVGRKVVGTQAPVYIALNKPAGFLSTCSDPEERRTVLDLVPRHFGRIFHVGRLDKESEGLILLTNDGFLAQELSHPSHSVEKEYEVILDKPLDWEKKPKLLAGFHIDGGRAKMERVTRITPQKYRVILRQGIKRQIRLMFYHLGYEVVRLTRIRIGPVYLDELRPAEWRHLSRNELNALRGKTQAPRKKSAQRRTEAVG